MGPIESPLTHVCLTWGKLTRGLKTVLVGLGRLATGPLANLVYCMSGAKWKHEMSGLCRLVLCGRSHRAILNLDSSGGRREQGQVPCIHVYFGCLPHPSPSLILFFFFLLPSRNLVRLVVYLLHSAYLLKSVRLYARASIRHLAYGLRRSENDTGSLADPNQVVYLEQSLRYCTSAAFAS